MRLLLPSTAKSSLFGAPSAAISVVAHVVLIGASIYGTGVRARELREEIAQQVAYLPPPDRRPAEKSSVERLEYIEVGGGVSSSATVAPTSVQAGEPRPDRDRAGGDRGRDQLTERVTVPVLSADSVFSILEVDETAIRMDGSAAPVYPPEMLRDGVAGRVLVQYVVDTTGRADVGSLEVLQESNPAFVRSVREALAGMRFTPAMIRQQRVRQVVEQSFEFKLTPTTPAEHTRATPSPSTLP
jgi:protein TonB